MFFGRENELRRLDGLWRKSVSSLVTIRGRRRIGKSTLVYEFARRSGARFIKLEGLQPKEGVDNDMQLAAFGRQLARQVKGSRSKPADWFDAFSRLEKVLKGKGKIVVLLDEISWMGKYDPGFAGELKYAWDNWFSRRPRLIVFLCGSVSAWIEKNIVKSKAFVGRPSMNLTLRDLPMDVCVRFWGRNAGRTATREILDVLSVTGGVPKYLENIDPSISADENIRNLCYRPGALLVDEFEEIFHDSLDENLSAKKAILKSLVGGPLVGEEIADKLGVAYNGHVTGNMSELEMSGVVARDSGINPSTGKETKTCRWRISDNYTRFYLKYIEPNLALIGKDAYRFASLDQLPDWEGVLGLQFECLILNNIDLLLPLIGLDRALLTSAAPYRQNKTERLKGCQIDLVIQTRKSVYCVEIKRQNSIGEKVVDECEEKISRLKVKNTRTVRPVLVYDGDLSRRVPADAFFSFIVSSDDLIGRNAAGSAGGF
ncbi:MAG: ATP-binding protein [Kiritimatiellae bacterium]|nr:ATP-binding protein [Kiritimatiellia bacterium]